MATAFSKSKVMRRGIYIAPDERRLVSRFWQSASGYWRGPSAWRARLLVGLLIAIVVLQLLTQYWLNFWNRDFFNAIERKDGLALWVQALHFMFLANFVSIAFDDRVHNLRPNLTLEWILRRGYRR